MSEIQNELSLGDRAYRDLRELIITCEIEPGAWVTESQLAVRLGVGKTPTREALRRLASEGFATPSHRRGYQITPITVAHAREVFEAFRVVLPDVAVLVAERASPDDKRRLAEVTLNWSATEDPAVHPEPPFPLFVALSRNPTIVEMANRVFGHLERMTNFARYHGALLDPQYVEAATAALGAIDGGDGEDVRRRLQTLLDHTMRVVIDALLASPSLMTAPVGMARSQASG